MQPTGMQQAPYPPTSAAPTITATLPSPSRSALYRARKRHGGPIRQRRDAEDLAALASKPPQQRTSAEKKALRNQKAYTQLKAKKALSVEEEGAAVGASNAITSDAAALASLATPIPTRITAPPSALPALFDTASSTTSAAVTTATPTIAVTAAITAAAAAAVPADAAAPAFLSESHLLRCATAFAATLTSKQQRCLPFTFDSEHLGALQTAVEQRALQDIASAESDSLVAVSAPPASRLCASDLQLLQSCLTMLQRWPCWMQQQWLAMSAKKIAKSEVHRQRVLLQFHTRNQVIGLTLVTAFLLLSSSCSSLNSTSKRLCTTSSVMWRCGITLRLDMQSDAAQQAA